MIELLLELGTNRARLSGGTVDYHRGLENTLTVREQVRGYANRYNTVLYPRCKYNEVKRFTIMHIGMVEQYLYMVQRRNQELDPEHPDYIKVNVAYSRKELPDMTPEINLEYFRYPLYPHQIECLRAVRERGSVREVAGIEMLLPTGIINATTNAGKNAIMLGIAANYPKAKVLMLVDSKSIAAQAVKEFREAEFSVSTLLAGYPTPRSVRDIKQITVATPTFFANCADKQNWLLSIFDILLVDECHKIADAFNATLSRILAPIRYGLSGTVDKSSSKIKNAQVRENLGHDIFQVTAQAMVEQGLSRRPIIYINHVKTQRGHIGMEVADTTGLTWLEQERLMISKNPALEQLIIDIIRKKEASLGYTPPTVVFVNKIEHGQRLVKVFESAGYNAAFANGVDSNTTTLVAQFNKGDLDVLIGNKVISTGINMAAVEMGINAAGGKSAIELLQRLGRVLRRKEGLDTIDVHDFIFGQDVMDKHTKLRVSEYKKAGHEVVLTYAHRTRSISPLD